MLLAQELEKRKVPRIGMEEQFQERWNDED